MATVDLRTEAKQILDKLSDESLGVVISLLVSLKDRECPKRTDLLSIYPWVRYLSDAECDEFFEELSNAAKDNGAGVDDVIDAWRGNRRNSRRPRHDGRHCRIGKTTRKW